MRAHAPATADRRPGAADPGRPVESAASTAAAPLPDRLIWVLVDGRAGDDRQLTRIAEGLGWPYRLVPARRSIPEVVAGRVLDAVAGGRLVPGRIPEGPPWPDVVLAAGGRNVSLARRIRDRSGGRARLVFLGAPYARLSDFDLVVTTPQWRLPARANVICNLLPLNWPEPGRLEEATLRWVPRLRHLPRPWLAVLVGGPNSSFRVAADDGRRLAAKLNAAVGEAGGAALITTSRRTPGAAIAALAEGISAPHHLYRWSAGDADNPYLGYLALADRFIVTNDTASMVADAVSTGRPVELFALRQRAVSRALTRPWMAGRDAPDDRQYAGAGPGDRLRRWLIEQGLWTPARDLDRLARRLEACGQLGEARRASPPCAADLQRTIDGIRAMVEQGPTGSRSGG